MKILIADTPDTQAPFHDKEEEILKSGLGDCEVVVHDYNSENREAFLKELEDADALLTAYVMIDEEAMNRAKKLKIISVSSTGYDNIDLEAANKRNIGVSPIKEYCTEDVAEYTITVMLSLVKNLKQHVINVERNGKWEYDYVTPNSRLQDMTLGILGLGKIGKSTAKKALSLGMQVVAVDNKVKQEDIPNLDVKMVNKEILLEVSDIISNHMDLNETNHYYFDYDFFKNAEKNPYFINTCRGRHVVEEELVKALDEGLIKGAALDVVANETKDLDLINHPLTNRENVLVTAHMAFYTTTSIMDIIRYSSNNIVNFLNGDWDKMYELINEDSLEK